MPAAITTLATAPALEARALPRGGFAPFPGGAFCPAATAWALTALPGGHSLAAPACRALIRAIRPDGSLPMAPDQPQALWPTVPALMALLGPPEHAGEAARLARYLLASSGAHWPKDPDVLADHDTGILGWSWTLGAHSWAEPTASAMLALAAAGHADHERLRLGREMLMDRQMPSGGWNYGNVRVFGARLVPDMVNTGAALCALAGRAVPGTVANSLEFMERSATTTRAPLSLSWCVLALGSWGHDTSAARQRLAPLLADHPVTGPLHTATLALGRIALESLDGLAAHLGRRSKGETGHAA